MRDRTTPPREHGRSRFCAFSCRPRRPEADADHASPAHAVTDACENLLARILGLGRLGHRNTIRVRQQYALPPSQQPWRTSQNRSMCRSVDVHQFRADSIPNRKSRTGTAHAPRPLRSMLRRREGEGSDQGDRHHRLAPGNEPAWRTRPFSFIYGDQDLNIPVEALAFMSDRASAVTAQLVPGGSHALPVSQPTLVAEMITAAADAVA
jgi:pimeloyl-ACP methyl ester carboxylesterase